MNCNTCVCKDCPLNETAVLGYARCWDCHDCNNGDRHCEYCSTKEHFLEEEE